MGKRKTQLVVGSEALLACPFCGGEPKMNASMGEWWVTCACNSAGPLGNSEAEAASGWNRRASAASATSARNSDVPVRIKHTASGQYAALEERVRVHAYDDTPPALEITWGPQAEASTLLASTARAVAAAWICVMDDSSIEIEEVEL